MVFFSVPRIDIFKYVIYGIAAAFFVYGILLMVEGFFTTGAIKDLYGDFKSPPVADVWALGYVISLHSAWNMGWFQYHMDACTHLKGTKALFKALFDMSLKDGSPTTS